MHTPDELRGLVEEALAELELWPQLEGQQESTRYALVEMGGKRVRPVISLAVGEALGADPEQVMPAALALEMVHNFSLVHDDLPSLDADEERRGKPSVWAAYGEGTAVLAGDALLAEAFRLACSYPTSRVARELAEATLGMIGGQYLDTMETDADLETVHRLKTGCLFFASVSMPLWAVELAGGRAGPVARVRRRARPALPDRRRHPGRRRLRDHARPGCGTGAGGRGRRAGARPARGDSRGHHRARGDRRGARRAHGLR